MLPFTSGFWHHMICQQDLPCMTVDFRRHPPLHACAVHCPQLRRLQPNTLPQLHGISLSTNRISSAIECVRAGLTSYCTCGVFADTGNTFLAIFRYQSVLSEDRKHHPFIGERPAPVDQNATVHLDNPFGAPNGFSTLMRIKVSSFGVPMAAFQPLLLPPTCIDPAGRAERDACRYRSGSTGSGWRGMIVEVMPREKI